MSLIPGISRITSIILAVSLLAGCSGSQPGASGEADSAGTSGSLVLAGDGPGDVYELSREALKGFNFDLFTNYVEEQELVHLQEILWDVFERLHNNSKASSTISQAFGVQYDGDKLRPMTPKNFFIAFSKGLVQINPSFGPGISDPNVKVIGEFREGDTLAHILTRADANLGQIIIPRLEVISFKKVDGEWKRTLTGQFEASAAGLRAQMLLTLAREAP